MSSFVCFCFVLFFYFFILFYFFFFFVAVVVVLVLLFFFSFFFSFLQLGKSIRTRMLAVLDRVAHKLVFLVVIV